MEGVVNSIIYRDGKRYSEVNIDDISEAITKPGSFIWLGLHEPELPLLLRIQKEFHLHELAIEDACNAHQRPKIEVYGDSVFIVLKTAQLEGDNVEYGETHLFLGHNFLVSVRHGPSTSYIKVRERCEAHPLVLSKGPGFAVYALIDFIVDNYQQVAMYFENRFDQIESDIFQEHFNRGVVERLYGLKRQLLQLRNATLPVEEICKELMRFHDDIIPKDARLYFRDIQDHTARVIGLIDNMREMLTTAMQVHLALVAVGQNEVVKRLAGWGAILAIPTVIFSLYGMNFRIMPELHWHYGYPVVVSATFISCSLLYRKLMRAGWL